jgi:hypothetical protein
MGGNGRTPVVRGAIIERPILGLFYTFQSWTGMTANAALLSLVATGQMAATGREFAFLEAESSRSENPNSRFYTVGSSAAFLHATGISPIALS